jgi:hypothetical protein
MLPKELSKLLRGSEEVHFSASRVAAGEQEIEARDSPSFSANFLLHFLPHRF